MITDDERFDCFASVLNAMKAEAEARVLETYGTTANAECAVRDLLRQIQDVVASADDYVLFLAAGSIVAAYVVRPRDSEVHP